MREQGRAARLPGPCGGAALGRPRPRARADVAPQCRWATPAVGELGGSRRREPAGCVGDLTAFPGRVLLAASAVQWMPELYSPQHAGRAQPAAPLWSTAGWARRSMRSIGAPHSACSRPRGGVGAGLRVLRPWAGLLRAAGCATAAVVPRSEAAGASDWGRGRAAGVAAVVAPRLGGFSENNAGTVRRRRRRLRTRPGGVGARPPGAGRPLGPGSARALPRAAGQIRERAPRGGSRGSWEPVWGIHLKRVPCLPGGR